MSNSAQTFATKLAFVPDASASASPAQASSKIPSTPSIGDKKPTRPTPPAMAGAQAASKITRPAPPTSPQNFASQQAARFASNSMRPSIMKTASEFGKETGRKIKKAPRYSSRGRKGKKVMPMPHASRTKKAYDLMNNSCEFIGTIDSDRVHDGMQTARAIEGYLAPTTDLEKIAKWNYIKRQEREKSASDFGKNFAKQALGGIGTTIGAVGGAMGAPEGNKMEGMGRGAGQGLGWDVGGGIGGLAGAGAGGLGGGALGALIAQLTGSDPGAGAAAGAPLGAMGGGLMGYLGGGELGRRGAQSMMGDPTYEDQPQRMQDNSLGDEDADAAQMMAP